jgi:hypothetical protein
MGIIALRCTCKHAFQDGRYGQGMRVHNPMVKENRARCTVCGAEHDVRDGGGSAKTTSRKRT